MMQLTQSYGKGSERPATHNTIRPNQYWTSLKLIEFQKADYCTSSYNNYNSRGSYIRDKGSTSHTTPSFYQPMVGS